jgi:hypothetical protein
VAAVAFAFVSLVFGGSSAKADAPTGEIVSFGDKHGGGQIIVGVLGSLRAVSQRHMFRGRGYVPGQERE